MVFSHWSKFSQRGNSPTIIASASAGLALLLLGAPTGRNIVAKIIDHATQHEQKSVQEVSSINQRKYISGLGVTQPVGEVRTIFANDSLHAHAVVEALLVDQGQSVRKGEIIAYLKGYKKAQTILAGLKQTLPSLETLVSLRRDELTRSQMLFREGAGTEEATKLRTIDLHTTIRERQELVAEISNAAQNLADLTVRAPVSGMVLKVNAREGERISPEMGLITLSPSSRIEVKAEIYENRAALISIGDEAEITSQYGAFQKPISGRVTSIGKMVNRRKLVSPNPKEQIDARVVEVHIMVEQSGQPTLRKLIGSTVIAKITKEDDKDD